MARALHPYGVMWCIFCMDRLDNGNQDEAANKGTKCRQERHFKSVGGADSRIFRNNLKFHTLMVLGWVLNQNTNLPALRIAQLDLTKMTDQQVKKVADWVFAEFSLAGPEDKTAKDSAFTQRLKANWFVGATTP